MVGLDLRDSLAIEEFCRMILARFKRVDILINNACQVGGPWGPLCVTLVAS